VRQSGVQIMFLRGQDELEIVHSTNPLDIGLIVGVDDSVTGHAIRERKTIVVGDVSRESAYVRMLGPSIQSEIAVPILFGDDGIAIGVLNVENEKAQAFHGPHELLLENFAGKVSTLLAFTKMLAEVTDTLEARSADDLLVAVGEQASQILHRINKAVDAIRLKILELQEMRKDGSLNGNDFFDKSLQELLTLAERTLQMPDEATLLVRGESDVDVTRCVQDAIGSVYLPSNIQLQVELDEHIPAIQLYYFDIVVQNLLQNGVEAMPAGGILSVSTSMFFDSSIRMGYFQLIVQDTGQGIPFDIQRRVFELNFTTKHEKGKGLGLGLWWVRNFVLRVRGDITIRSTPGSGTEVTVKIPLGRTEEERPRPR